MQLEDEVCRGRPRNGKSLRQRHGLPTRSPDPQRAGEHPSRNRSLREAWTGIRVIQLLQQLRVIHGEDRVVDNTCIAGPVLNGAYIFFRRYRQRQNKVAKHIVAFGLEQVGAAVDVVHGQRCDQGGQSHDHGGLVLLGIDLGALVGALGKVVE